jgi:hypothetical protein
MQARRFYQSRLLVLAITLLVLGVGNAIIGSQKLGPVPNDRRRRSSPRLLPGRRHVDRPHLASARRRRRALQHRTRQGRSLSRRVERRARDDGVGVVLSIIGWLRLRLRESRRRPYALS